MQFFRRQADSRKRAWLHAFERLEDRRQFNCDNGGFVSESPLTGDVNLDGKVTLNDFALLRSHFGAANISGRQEGDLTGDRKADLADFAQIRSGFGKSAPSCLWEFPSVRTLATQADGELAFLANAPDDALLPRLTDADFNRSFRTVTIEPQPGLKRILEYYDDGSLRSRFFVETGKKEWYRKGATTTPNDGLAWYIYFPTPGKIVEYANRSPGNAGNAIWEMRDDGFETRRSFYPDGSFRQQQFFYQGARYNSVFYSSTPTDQDPSFQIDYRNGLMDYNFANGETRVSINPKPSDPSLVSLFNEQGREYLYGDPSGAWTRIKVWNEAQPQILQSVEFWTGDHRDKTQVFDTRGNFFYNFWNEDIIQTRPFQRDPQTGLAILPSSDESLAIVNLLADVALESPTVLPHALWSESMVLTQTLLQAEESDPTQWAARYKQQLSNFQFFNPHIPLGSLYATRLADPKQIADVGVFPYHAIPLDLVPAEYVVSNPGENPEDPPVQVIDFTNAEARRWLTEHLVATGLGQLDRPKLEHMFLDGIAVDELWPQRVEVLSEVKRRLNESGVGFHLNIGGYGFQDRTDDPRDYMADYANVANVVRVESPWRLATGVPSDRIVSTTQQIINNMRSLLDKGVGIEILPADFLASGLDSTTVKRPILSVTRTTTDYEGRQRNALLVKTDGPHHIFPTAGQDDLLIELANLPAGYQDWKLLNNSTITFRPLPTAAEDEVLLVYTKPDNQDFNLGPNDLINPDGAYLFDHGQTDRMMAAFAMIVRNPGHKIGMLTSITDRDLPGGGDPKSPDNWFYWPRNLGAPTADYVIDARPDGTVNTLSRQFANGSVTLYAQEGYAEVRLFTAQNALPSAADNITWETAAVALALQAALTEAEEVF